MERVLRFEWKLLVYGSSIELDCHLVIWYNMSPWLDGFVVILSWFLDFKDNAFFLFIKMDRNYDNNEVTQYYFILTTRRFCVSFYRKFGGSSNWFVWPCYWCQHCYLHSQRSSLTCTIITCLSLILLMKEKNIRNIG